MTNSTFFLAFILTSEIASFYFPVIFCHNAGLDTLEINMERQGLTIKLASLTTNKVPISRKKK